MSYVGSMMEGSAVVYRPNISHDARHGVVQEPFIPIDPETGGPAENRLEPEPLPCSVQQASPRDIILYGQNNAEFGTTVIFDRNPYCQKNDQLRITDYTGNVTYYQVTGAAIPTGRGQQWVVTASYVQQPFVP